MLSVLVIMAVFMAVAIPSWTAFIRTKKGEVYLSEAKFIYTATQGYLMEQSLNEDHSKVQMVKDLCKEELGSPNHVLEHLLDGNYTKGSKIFSVQIGPQGELKGLIYDVDGYRLDIINGEAVNIYQLETKKSSLLR